MNIGIDKISFYVPRYYLKLKSLANARHVDPLKYTQGLMQEKMSVAPGNEDIISMGANAALQILNEEDIKNIDLVLFATESGVDYSKAAASNLISLLNLKSTTRFVELKQACYAGTAALRFAQSNIYQNPKSKVLIITSDIAKYGLSTDGEPTQGAGSVAMLITESPRIAVINEHYGVHSENIYDFYRPNGNEFAIVDGHFSNEQYKKFFIHTFNTYVINSQTSLDSLEAICFHIPYAKIGYKSLKLFYNETTDLKKFEHFKASIKYNQLVGNIYTGSLYLSLISLIENAELKAGQDIGMYSYGSGAIAEFYSLKLVKGFEQYTSKNKHDEILNSRFELSMMDYEDIIINNKPMNHSDRSMIYLDKINNGQRFYIKRNT